MVETGTGLNQELYLARAGDTRWGSHFRVLLRLKKLFTPVVEVLEELKYNRAASEAKEKEVFSTVDDRDIINRFQAMKKRRMTIKL
ncbi:hypothetical protein LIER_19121 [Lithospermum erythrorhizon]|uniref:Uncharacterized protein n=1 Tax=Lithospermum erythrorhizon TaxID=34254 RepID=A0AAV3QJ58_LITER